MSFDECIINGQREGSITEDQARYARDLFEQSRADMIEELGEPGAAAAAARRGELGGRPSRLRWQLAICRNVLAHGAHAVPALPLHSVHSSH